MCITVDHEYASGGETNPETWIWADASCPPPDRGEPVTWDHRHVWLRGIRYDKRENDMNPGKLWL